MCRFVRRVFSRFMQSLKSLTGKPSYHTVLLPAIHLGVIYIVYQFLMFYYDLPEMIVYNFKAWDSGWYASIAEKGYVFSAETQSNVAFYPLFPFIWKLLWKVTEAGVEGVCLFNFCVFFAGLFVLKRTLGFSWWYLMFFASIPSSMFMFVPYTEALFFLFCSVFIAGLKFEDNR